MAITNVRLQILRSELEMTCECPDDTGRYCCCCFGAGLRLRGWLEIELGEELMHWDADFVVVRDILHETRRVQISMNVTAQMMRKGERTCASIHTFMRSIHSDVFGYFEKSNTSMASNWSNSQ